MVAPSLISKKPGDRVKTNRRDAVSLAKLLRAGELTAVWVPDRHHEAMRDLTRARDTAVDDLRSKRQQISAFLLRKGLHYCAGKKTWSQAHLELADEPKVRIPGAPPGLRGDDDGDAPGARAAGAARTGDPCCGGGLVTGRFGHCADGYARHRFDFGGNVLAEIGDLSRFQPCELMAYLGLVPSEGFDRRLVKRGPVTKAGNRRARRMLVECTWSYQHPPWVGKDKQEKVAAAPPAVREIAWKAQSRLNRRYRALIRRGKLKTVAITAVAREFAGFIWAVAREATAARAAAK